MQLPSSDLEIVRTHPQITNLNLSIFQPRVVFACKINDPSIARGARTLSYNNASGSFSAVEPGMTLLVGSSAGSRDIGKVRIKSATSSQIVVAENSDIDWQNGQDLTVLRYWEVWPVYPRIIHDPNNDEDVIFYKDYDIPYTNQNSVLGVLPCAGSHRADFTGAQIYYTASGTLPLMGQSLNYNWSFEGGTPTGSTSANPGYVSYPNAGQFVTRLVISGSNGSIETMYRYVSIYNRPENSPTGTPPMKWEMDTLSGSRGEGGYRVGIKVTDQVLNVNDGDVVVIWSDDWYGDTHRSLGGNALNNSSILFTGHVLRDSVRYDYKSSSVSFEVGSITDLMKETDGFSVSVESTSAPTRWYKLLDMDSRRAIYHYLRWHSTVLTLSDIEFIGNDQKIQFFDADRTSLFDAIDNYMRNTLVGSLVSDEQGKLWAEMDAGAYPNPTGSFQTMMSITKRDWMNEPSFDERLHGDLSYLEYGGIAYSGSTTGTFAALLSGAPGNAPASRGKPETMSGLALSSQDQLNIMIGHVFANRNAEYSPLNMDMAGSYRNLDIAPQRDNTVQVDIATGDTARGVEIHAPYIVDEISQSYNSQNKILISKVRFKALVNGIPGETITIPATPSDANNGLGFKFPKFSTPPLPAVAPLIAIIDPANVKNVQIAIKNRGIYFTEDIDSISPTWYPMNTNLPDVTHTSMFETSATGRMYYLYGTDSLYVAEFPGAIWRKLFDTTMIGNPESFPFPTDPEIMAFGINRHADDELLIVAGLIVTIFTTCIIYSWYGSSAGVTRTTPNFIEEVNPAERLGYLTLGDNQWILSYYDDPVTTPPAIAKLSRNGSSLSGQQAFSGGAMMTTRSIKSTNVAIIDSSPARITTNGGTTWVPISGSPVPYGQALADEFQSIITNDDGQQIVIGTAAGSFGLVYSKNGGASWITGSIASDITAVWHLGQNGYLLAAPNQMLFVNDLVNNPNGIVDKTGNLNSLVTGTYYITEIRHY